MIHNHDFTADDLPPRNYRKRRVELDGRVFFVGVNPDGSPRNIVERRMLTTHGKTKRRSLGVSTYWHHSHGIPKGSQRDRGRKSIVQTILEKAGVDTRFIAGH